jgi:pyruvate/2-oxoglutarate dehydrogenase complex dihydrolipoamide dehydrogenase (E3) component
LPETPHHTNETIFNLTERPARLLVIGAGAVGCELAQAFARLGSRVTVLDQASRPLSNDDPDAAAIVERALCGDGVRFELGVTITRVTGWNGGVAVEFRRAADRAAEQAAGDILLVAAGRMPNVEGLDVTRARIDAGPRGIVVNERLRTTNRRVYAAGDVCSRLQFTHVADATARIVVQNALFFGRRKASALTIPWCTYTDPEVAHVGLSEQEAQRRGVAVRTFVQTLRDVDRAVLDGEAEGFAKVHVRAGTDRIVGATIVARHAGEMLPEVTLAMSRGLGLGDLASVIHAYPTQAEAIRKLGDAWNRTRLTPRTKRLLAAWLAWRR